MKKTITVILSAILLFSLSACTPDAEPELSVSAPSEPTPSPSEQPPAPPAAEPTTPPWEQPVYSPKPPFLIEKVTVNTALKWNTFARDFNEEKQAFAEPLTVVIDGRLNFAGRDFVPLGRPFNGTIHGTGEMEGYTEEAVRRESISPGGYSGGECGFYNIKTLEKTKTSPTRVYSAEQGFSMIYEISGEPDLDEYRQGGIETEENPYVTVQSLFGIRCGDLTLENLMFSNVNFDDFSHIIANSVDTLTMRNIGVKDCNPRQTNALLAGNAGRLQVENLFVSRCNVTLLTCGGGLFTWVYENAAFSRVGILHSSFFLIPDGGGSGYSAGPAALLVSRAGGDVSFSQIEVYHCSMYSLNSVVLCHSYGSLSELSDISVRSSSFLGFPIGEGDLTSPRDNAMLFGGSNPPAGRNILLQDSMFNAYGRFEDYEGYVIENCIDVTASPDQP